MHTHTVSHEQMNTHPRARANTPTTIYCGEFRDETWYGKSSSISSRGNGCANDPNPHIYSFEFYFRSKHIDSTFKLIRVSNLPSFDWLEQIVNSEFGRATTYRHIDTCVKHSPNMWTQRFMFHSFHLVHSLLSLLNHVNHRIKFMVNIAHHINIAID